MSDEVGLERDEIDNLEQIVTQYRDALGRRIFEMFPAEKAAEAFCLALGMLFVSGFTDEVEQQHDMALGANQLLARAVHAKIAWRVAPLTV
jgi:hypothetical protein